MENEFGRDYAAADQAADPAGALSDVGDMAAAFHDGALLQIAHDSAVRGAEFAAHFGNLILPAKGFRILFDFERFQLEFQVDGSADTFLGDARKSDPIFRVCRWFSVYGYYLCCRSCQ